MYAQGQASTSAAGTPNQSEKKEFQRSFKACDGCRTKKVKCDLGSLNAPSEPPCSRCKREMRQCLFTMSTRGRGPNSRSARAQAFGVHHLTKQSDTASRMEDGPTSAIDALAGAALAALPDTNPRLRSAKNDVLVTALDPEDAPSIGMIYGLNRKHSAHDSHKRRRATPDRIPDDNDSLRGSTSMEDEQNHDDHGDDGHQSTSEDHTSEQRPDALQQYASVGLQHSRDALRVLAGVAVETRDSTVSRGTASEEEVEGTTKQQATNGEPSDPNQPIYRSNVGDSVPYADSPSAQPPGRSAVTALQSRPITPPALKHTYGWSKFEPIRIKLIKRSEAKYFLNFFIRQMHSFAPHCSPHLLDRSPEALSELVGREPILLGAMLSVASRYDVANQNAHVSAPDTFHRKISKWTQEKISRSFFLPQSHTIGTIEALLILSEWATLDLHDRRASPDASSESEDEGNNDDDDEDMEERTRSEAVVPEELLPGLLERPPAQPRRQSTKSAHRVSKADMRESEKFDDTAWMLTGTALRLAERLDLQNDATYGGISSPNISSRRNAERRMRVWMSCVHADCHLSVRLGRRISSPGLAAPFMNLVRDRTHPFLIRSDTSSSTGLSDTGFTTGSPRAWIAFRAHSELLQIVFRTCENLYRSKAVTERLLEDEDFVPALKSIRDDLDDWANWTQPRIEPIRDMTSLRVRVEYHYARLYANGIALDSVKRSLGTMRPQKQESLGVGFSTHPAYPFVREALAAAQSLIRILTVELDSMMCAPARWFLLLVMAAVFCVKATAVSDSILPLKRCAQSLQQVISALTKAAPDGIHLANRYSMYLRQLAKQLVLTDANNKRGRSKKRSSPSAKQPQVPTAPAYTPPEQTWWSTGDVLAGEVDPQTFLKWLDEQTSVPTPTEVPAWPPVIPAPTPPIFTFAATPTTAEQDSLLTRMWLDDALTDLASVGLDTPFL